MPTLKKIKARWILCLEALETRSLLAGDMFSFDVVESHPCADVSSSSPEYETCHLGDEGSGLVAEGEGPADVAPEAPVSLGVPPIERPAAQSVDATLPDVVEEFNRKEPVASQTQEPAFVPLPIVSSIGLSETYSQDDVPRIDLELQIPKSRNAQGQTTLPSVRFHIEDFKPSETKVEFRFGIPGEKAQFFDAEAFLEADGMGEIPIIGKNYFFEIRVTSPKGDVQTERISLPPALRSIELDLQTLREQAKAMYVQLVDFVHENFSPSQLSGAVTEVVVGTEVDVEAPDMAAGLPLVVFAGTVVSRKGQHLELLCESTSGVKIAA